MNRTLTVPTRPLLTLHPPPLPGAMLLGGSLATSLRLPEDTTARPMRPLRPLYTLAHTPFIPWHTPLYTLAHTPFIPWHAPLLPCPPTPHQARFMMFPLLIHSIDMVVSSIGVLSIRVKKSGNVAPSRLDP